MKIKTEKKKKMKKADSLRKARPRFLLLLNMTRENWKSKNILVRMWGIGGSGCFSRRHQAEGRGRFVDFKELWARHDEVKT